MITWCLCFLEICSAIPTTLHFQCFFYLVTVVFADFACHSYQHNILEMFLYLVYLLFLVVALATTVSALVDEGIVG